MSRGPKIARFLLPVLALGLAVCPRPSFAGPVSVAKLDDAGLARAHSLVRKLGSCNKWQVAAKQSFRIDGAGHPYDKGAFISATCNDDRGRAGFVFDGGRGESLLWKDHAANEWATDEIAGVMFTDLNGDDVADVLVAVSAMTGAGPTGAKPFLVFDALVSGPRGFQPLARPHQGALDPAKTLMSAAKILKGLLK